MKNEVQIFSNPQFGEIRTISGEDNEPLFCAADVCKALGYSNPRKAVGDHVEEPDVTKRDIGVVTGKKADGSNACQIVSTSFVNESGLYSLIFGSKLDSARAFKKWVTSEVLPSIRKHGAYMTDSVIERTLQDPDYLIQIATKLKEEKQKRIEAEELASRQKRQIEAQQETISQQAPKVAYHDEVLTSKSTFTTTEIAAFYGHSAKWLNEKLHKLGLQYKLGKMWHLYEKFKSKGLSRPTVFSYIGTDGTTRTREQMEWTEVGRKFIHQLLSDNNVLKEGKEVANAV